MPEFTGANVLITGAASGLGRGLAEALAARGANLILWDLNAAGLEAAKADLDKHAGFVITYVCDLTDREAVYAVAERVLAKHGHIDILVNNAGIVSGKPLLEISDEAIERTFAVNTLALFWMTRAFLPKMIERRQGHIVTMASSGGIVGTARLTDYSASKFAAVGFDESLRLEFKRRGLPIHTTVVCPFYIDTGMFEGVKTRFPALLPILKPDYVVRRMVRAIEKKKARLIMPRFVYMAFPLRVLPTWVFDALVDFFGITRSMDEFTGRAGMWSEESI